MSGTSRRSTGPPPGRVTLALTLAFLLTFRVEQNVAYVFGLSTRQLVGTDVFPVGAVVQILAPLVHATADHLVSSLVWFVPFGYFLERRHPDGYIGFVVLVGVLTTAVGPAAFVVLGLSEGLAVGASGITAALVAREATARMASLADWRSLSRSQWAILTVAVLGLLFRLASLASGASPGTSVAGHATGLVAGFGAGVGERYVSAADG